MKKKGFTLVEMLIVVVIIGILGAALVPRLQGTIAQTRDMKRQTDLRNIATAIQIYENEHGELPVVGSGEGKYFTRAGNLDEALREYISGIPQDPQKNIQIDICGGESREKCKELLGGGEYLYQIVEDPGTSSQIGLLLAKVETAGAANFMVINEENYGWEWRPLALYSWGNKKLQLASLGISRFLGLGKGNKESRLLELDNSNKNIGDRVQLAATPCISWDFEKKCVFDSRLNKFIQKTCCKTGGEDYCWWHGEGEDCSPTKTEGGSYVLPISSNKMLCDELDKVPVGEEGYELRSNGKQVCHYSSISQLYYMAIIN